MISSQEIHGHYVELKLQLKLHEQNAHNIHNIKNVKKDIKKTQLLTKYTIQYTG